LEDACGCTRRDPPWTLSVSDVAPSQEVPLLEVARPEDEGIDADLLEAGVAMLAEHETLFSTLVLRNNRIVLERYFHGGAAGTAHNIQSVTKCILSALVGIAVQGGFIGGVDRTAAAVFPALFTNVQDLRMLDITLRDLLTMTPGFIHDDPTEGVSLNLIASALSSTLVAAPGTTFSYNSISSHILSAVLADATRMSTCAFACRYLFEPIGVTVDNWSCDAQGIYVGGAALYLTPRELARFGLLYLNRGAWSGHQVVPADWVEESTARHIEDTGSPGWGYGYGWWLSMIAGHSAFAALGAGGQTVYVVPDLDLVVVTTADSLVASEGIPVSRFLEDFVIPAIEGSGETS
jgi:CubicO group peptidase (beta-lactamase class C family)